MEKDTRAVRLFRVYDAHLQKQLRGRCYIDEKRAARAAAVICLEETRPGRTLEVINIRSMSVKWTFTKSATGNIIVKDRAKLLAEERRK